MLQQVSIYLLKVICISSLLFFYYHIALRNKRFHYYNRFYLLMTIVMSIALPWMRLQWFTFFSSSLQTIHLYDIIYGSGDNEIIATGSVAINSEGIILYALLLTTICLLIIQCMRIFKIQRLKKRYPVQHLLQFDFINTDIASAPFSFLKNIFWRKDISLEDETGRQILQHEITHIQQKHSWDKLFIQTVLCFYWMNPCFHLIKKELYLIHEFIADEEAVDNSDANAFARMLLTAQFGKFNFLPAQSIFYSSIKRRLTMLTTSKKSQFSYARRIMVLPLLTCIICLLAFTVKSKTFDEATQITTASNPFILVVDAGHGGKDEGAVSNGLSEKNLTLKIAQEIKKHSPEYGINVVLTRDDDIYMSPQDKSDFINAQHANAVISIHVNAKDAYQPNQSGFEVYVSRKNEKYLNNNQVLGSAILQNIGTDFKIEPAVLQNKIGIYVLDYSNIPSALIECGYLSNNTDANNLKDNAKIELMAKNILQGVAMYANNSFDKTNLYQLQNKDADTSIQPQSNSTIKAPTPLYVLDGKVVSKNDVDKLDPNTIESINVFKDKMATDKYGDKGKNGIVEINLKSEGVSFKPPMIVRDSDGMVNASDKIINKPIFKEAQVQPQFLGGKEGWNKYLMNNLDASILAKNKAPKGIYTVTVSFIVDENGKVSDVKALNDPGFGTSEEAVRVIAQGPDWIPAVQNGHTVVFANRQKIAFSIAD